jgi:hypothetical protein
MLLTGTVFAWALQRALRERKFRGDDGPDIHHGKDPGKFWFGVSFFAIGMVVAFGMAIFSAFGLMKVTM